MKVSFHKDNYVSLIIARTLPPKFTPHSKYYATKIIWFCGEINKSNIVLLEIITVEQLVNLFTNRLPIATFKYLRNKFRGW